MNRLLQIAEKITAWTGLKFNTRKFSKLDIDCRRKLCVLVTELRIGGSPMISIAESQEYCHLGIPMGLKVLETTEQDIVKMVENVKKIDENLLEDVIASEIVYLNLSVGGVVLLP